jgi:hypothetical protein
VTKFVLIYMQILKVALRGNITGNFVCLLKQLCLPPLFRVLIRRMKIAHGGLRGIQSAVLACLLAAAAS